MGFKVNFSDVQNFEAVPAGVYQVAVIEMEENTGNAGVYFKTTFEILDGEYAKRKLWSNLSLSPKAAWKLQEALISFGESPDVLDGDFEFDPDNYIGVECSIAVEQDHYEGRITNVVSAFLSGEKKTSTPKGAGKPRIR